MTEEELEALLRQPDGRLKLPRPRRTTKRLGSNWVPLRTDIADRTVDLSDFEYRIYVNLLALARRQYAEQRADCVILTDAARLEVAPNRRRSVALASRSIRKLAAKRAWAILEDDTKWVLHLEGWSENQGVSFNASETRRSRVRHACPSREEEKREEIDSAPSARLSSTPPDGDVGTSPQQEIPGTRPAGEGFEERIDRVWILLRRRHGEHARAHGRRGRWADVPGEKQRAMIRARMRDGATDDELLVAIDGAMRVWKPWEVRPRLGGVVKDGWSMIDVHRIYAPKHFAKLVEAGSRYGPAVDGERPITFDRVMETLKSPDGVDRKRSTRGEVRRWLQAKWGEIENAAQIEHSKAPQSDLLHHMQLIASYRFNRYLETGAPGQREFSKPTSEAQLRPVESARAPGGDSE